MRLPALLDGATGTQLCKLGADWEKSMELWVLRHPQEFLEVQRSYLRAGAQAITAPTFAANPAMLKRWGLEGRTGALNRALCALSRKAAGEKALVAGNLTCCGLGRTGAGVLAMVENYLPQVAALCEGGVDFYLIETMLNIDEARAAVMAVRKLDREVKVLVSFTCDKEGRTPEGADVCQALEAMEALGVDAFGLNCMSAEDMAAVLARLSPRTTLPLIAQPSADELEAPEDWAAAAAGLGALGVQIFGGCCGTTPEHIRCLAKKLKEKNGFQTVF